MILKHNWALKIFKLRLKAERKLSEYCENVSSVINGSLPHFFISKNIYHFLEKETFLTKEEKSERKIVQEIFE